VIESEVLALCSPEGDCFLRDHLHDSVDRLLLAMHGKVDPYLLRAVAEQISCREKLRVKQPRFAQLGAFVESSVLEQSTPQEVAEYRSTMMSGDSLCDCTGGLGVDTLALAHRFNQVVFCEIDPARALLFTYNSSRFGTTNCTVHVGDSMAFLRNSSGVYDWLFIDPARRDGSGKRFISLENCLPDVIGEAVLLREKSENIAIKISPAFDISMIYKQFEDCSRIVVVSLYGEVREIMVTIESNVPVQAIRAVILGKNQTEILDDDGFGDLEVATTSKRWLFEPDPAIIKAGLVDTLGRKYGLVRWSGTGIFLCGDEVISDFPGRQFEIIRIVPWQRKEIGRYLKEKKIFSSTVIRRDFPLTPEEIRALYKLQESDSQFLIFTTDHANNRVVIDCKKWCI